MSILFFTSIFCLLAAYPFSLNGSLDIALLLYFMTISFMVGACFKELGRSKKRKEVSYLRVVK